MQYLANENYGGSEYLSRLILLQSAAGQNVSELIDTLLPRANADGGFGKLLGHDSSTLDSAFALQVLHN